jgi:hypothetical protein
VVPVCKPCHEGEKGGAGGRPTARQETVETIRAAGGEMTTGAFIAALGITKGAASMRLTDAEAAGLVARSGRGGRQGPQVWRVATGRREDEA